MDAGKEFAVIGLVTLLAVLAMGATIGIFIQGRIGDTFTAMNTYTTGSPPYTSVVIAQQLTPIASLGTFNATDPAAIGTSAQGEAFIIATAYPVFLVNVSFSLNKTGSPVGNLTAEVFALTGTYGTSGKPTGASLENSSKLLMASLNATSVFYNFTFAGSTRLEPGTAYCVEVLALDATTLADANSVSVAIAADSYGGNSFQYKNGAVTTVATDTLFVAYGYASAHDIDTLTNIVPIYTGFMGILYTSWSLYTLMCIIAVASVLIGWIMLVHNR
jgi:hypothetical protein